MSVRFIWKKSCDTCRKYKKQLDAWGVAYEGREINAEPLGTEEIEALIGDRTVKPFLNTRNVVYRERGLSKATPDKARAATLIAALFKASGARAKRRSMAVAAATVSPAR